MTSHELSVQSRPVHLTKTEFAIIKILMQNPTQAIAKSVLLERISLDTPDCMESSLKVHISNIRRKLREVSGKEYIEAVWGIGFKLCEHQS
ncbi:Transcriptional regulatory protein OmpR [compost metagenome]